MAGASISMLMRTALLSTSPTSTPPSWWNRISSVSLQPASEDSAQTRDLLILPRRVDADVVLIGWLVRQERFDDKMVENTSHMLHLPGKFNFCPTRDFGSPRLPCCGG